MIIIEAILRKKKNENTGTSQWALVSKKDPSKVLKWFHHGKPSPETLQKEEKRVQYFKHKGKAEYKRKLLNSLFCAKNQDLIRR